MTILLWGGANDVVIQYLARSCAALGLDTVRADGDEIVSCELEGELCLGEGTRLQLTAITGVFVRPDGQLTTQAAVRSYQMLTAWTESTKVRVLNRQSAAASNRSKPYQLQLIADCGFAVPETLVTTTPADVLEFRTRHQCVIYKSVSGIRSIVTTLEAEDLARIDDITACPTQFQQFVPGVDFRVHVVGGDVFACRIDSDAVDYRYASATGRSAVVTAETLPRRIAHRCVDMTQRLGLELAGIDLRLDPQGNWWCFEVNTAPGFSWFEEQTREPIAAAIAALLNAPGEAPRQGSRDIGLQPQPAEPLNRTGHCL